MYLVTWALRCRSPLGTELSNAVSRSPRDASGSRELVKSRVNGYSKKTRGRSPSFQISDPDPTHQSHDASLNCHSSVVRIRVIVVTKFLGEFPRALTNIR